MNKNLLRQRLSVMLVALTACISMQSQTFTHYSEWMAYSRRNMVYTKTTPPYSTSDTGVDWWRYDDGLMYESILDTYEHYKTQGGKNSSDLLSGVERYLNKCITGTAASPSIANFTGKSGEGELDDMRPGRLVYKYCYTYDHSENAKIDIYKAACAQVINASAFSDSKRVGNSNGANPTYPWQHKANYANQVWLDGIFMGIPFWTLAGPNIGTTHHSNWTATDFFDDAYNQMIITDEKTYDSSTNLWKHAWDYTMTKTWADCSAKLLSSKFEHTSDETAISSTPTGRSCHTWGRALGWYAMAILETMDNITAVDDNYSHLGDLRTLFKKVMDAIISYRDETTGVWYCVMDVDDTKSPYNSITVTQHNYPEATCSSMFAYCLLRGVAKGYLDSSYLNIAKDVYKKVVDNFITTSGDNINLNSCMQVGGLDDSGRDGSFAYYMSEPVIQDDSKGVGPFIWASLEAEKIGYNIATNDFDNNTLTYFGWSKMSDDISDIINFTTPTFTATTAATTLSNNSEIDFTSSNTSVATVGTDGTVTLTGTAGTAIITAALKSGSSYSWGNNSPTYTVTVTAPDNTAPTLSSTTPAGNATDIATSGTVVLTFDEAVTVANASGITISPSTGVTWGTATVDASDNKKVNITYSGLSNSTQYTVTIANNAITDASGNAYAGSNFSFTTVMTQVATPTIIGTTPFTESTTATITCATDGATIHYTTDGSTPTSSSTTYSSPIAISATTTVKAIAVKSGMTDSEVASQTFTKSSGSGTSTYSFGFNQAILTAYDSNGTLLSSPSHDGTVIDISSYGSSAALSCGDAYVTSSSTKENCVSISNDASQNYGQNYVEISSTEEIKSIYLVAAVTGSTTASSAVAVGWTSTPSATISEYHTFTTPGRGDTSGKEITINFTTSGIKYVRLYRKIKLDKSTGTTFANSNSTTIPNSASTYGIAFIKVTTEPSASTYTVTLDKNGGTTDGTATATEESNKLTNITAPAWDGHTAAGYYKEVTCTNLIADAEGNLQASTDYTDANGKWTSTNAQTLYTKWLTNNDATFEDGSYTIGGSALDLSTLFTSSSNGAVTYAVSDANGTGAAISGTSFTASTVGSATVTATQAATATYAGTVKTATITVSGNPLGTHTITYTLDVTSSADNNKEDINSTNVSTSANLNTLVGITNNTGGSYTKGSKANLTVKIPTDATYNVDHYMSVGFTVADGYSFTPTSISVKAQPVTTAKTVKLVLTDGTNTIEKTQESLTAGSITTVTETNSGEIALTGDVTLKIYCYGATDTYRLGSPITIEGTVAEAFVPRTTTVTIKAGKQYASCNTTMPIDFDETEGLTAFIVKDASTTSIQLKSTKVVPASTALIIKGNPGTYTLYETAKTTEDVSANKLVISNNTVAADDKYYSLGTVNGVQGFHIVQNGLTIPTSYVIIENDGNSKQFILFDESNEEEDVVTSINSLNTKQAEIVIDDNTPIYNLSGQRVSKSYKGIVIVNGKKIVR